MDARVIEAADLILRRRRIQDSLADWCRSCGYEPARHHRLIIDALERLARSPDSRKVMLCMPPGSAKSTYASTLFPPWYLAHHPHASIIAASHSEDLAMRWGRRCRNLIEEQHLNLGIAVNPTNRAADRWQLEGDPLMMAEYLAVGAGSAVTGFRADLALIDDPVKGRDSVASETQRERLHEWYKFDLRTRLKPNAKQILICTRWHEDDLAGRILAEEGEEWEQLILPMLAERLDDPLGRTIGEPLWPEWFSPDMIETAQRDSVVWTSLYQQRPFPEEGGYFKRTWLHAVPPEHVPPRHVMRVYGGSDFATKAASGDYTVHCVIGLDPSDRPWLLELWRAQTTSDIWIREFCEIVKHWKPMTWAQESGQILSGVGPFIEREMHKQKAYTECVQFASRADKGTRAQSMRAHIAVHGLWYANDLEGRSDLEAELLAFPNARHDDIVDSIGLVGQLLDVAVHGQYPVKPKQETKVGYKTMRHERPSMGVI